MKLVSVIVPVYNVEKYVKDCIESIIRQTYDCFEIILVDDGSTDLSGELCENYSDMENVYVYHKENGGLSSARNYGIDRANGEYLAFVDSDDYWKEDFLETLVNALEENDADISLCRFTRKEGSFDSTIKNIKVETSEDVLKKVLYQKNDSLYSVAAWNKLYKRELFEQLRYPLNKLNEDMYIICELLYRAKKIAICDYKAYYYRVNNSSITQQSFSHKSMDVVDACCHIIDFISDNYNDLNLEKGAINMAFRRNFQMIVKLWKSAEKHSHDQKRLKENLIKYRKIVLLDKNSRKSSKLAALMLMFGFSVSKKIVLLLGVRRV